MDLRLLLVLLCLRVPPGQGLQADSTTVRVSGTIERFDPSTRILSLSTTHGAVRLPIPSSARIRQGVRKIDASDLQKLTGDRATVRYTESGGGKRVESVHVFGGPPSEAFWRATTHDRHTASPESGGLAGADAMASPLQSLLAFNNPPRRNDVRGAIARR